MCYDIKKMCRKSNPTGEGVGGEPVGPTIVLLFCSFIIVLTVSSHQRLRS